jgi:hypothetical protein
MLQPHTCSIVKFGRVPKPLATASPVQPWTRRHCSAVRSDSCMLCSRVQSDTHSTWTFLPPCFGNSSCVSCDRRRSSTIVGPPCIQHTGVHQVASMCSAQKEVVSSALIIVIHSPPACAYDAVPSGKQTIQSPGITVLMQGPHMVLLLKSQAQEHTVGQATATEHHYISGPCAHSERRLSLNQTG